MSITNTQQQPKAENNNIIKKTFDIVKKVKVSFEFLVALVVGTSFILELTRADITLGWYILSILILLGFIFDKFKDNIIPQKVEIVKDKEDDTRTK